MWKSIKGSSLIEAVIALSLTVLIVYLVTALSMQLSRESVTQQEHLEQLSQALMNLQACELIPLSKEEDKRDLTIDLKHYEFVQEEISTQREIVKLPVNLPIIQVEHEKEGFLYEKKSVQSIRLYDD